MRYRLLGRSGLRVSEFALGAMTFSDRGLSWGADPQASRRIFDTFAEAGGTFVDTANIYGDDVGGTDHASERVLRDCLAADREHFVVATKYTSSNTSDVSRSGNSAKAMRETVDACLAALGTDHVDLLWAHTWDGTTPVEEVLRAADQLVTAGKILYFGLSDTPAWVVSRAVTMAETRGTTPPIAIQVQYSPAQRSAENDSLAMAQSLDLGVTAWSPLAGGLLSGKYTRDGHTGARRHDDAAFAEVSDTTAGADRQAAVTVDEIADEIGCPSAHVALAWLRDRPGVVVPILGARTVEQLSENLAATDVTLSAEHRKRLDAATRPTPGFPEAFLATSSVRRYSTSGHYAELDNHRAHAYAEFAP